MSIVIWAILQWYKDIVKLWIAIYPDEHMGRVHFKLIVFALVCDVLTILWRLPLFFSKKISNLLHKNWEDYDILVGLMRLIVCYEAGWYFIFGLCFACMGIRRYREDWARNARGRQTKYLVQSTLSRDLRDSDLELASECPICA